MLPAGQITPNEPAGRSSPTIGGYPVIAIVASVDRGVIGQLGPVMAWAHPLLPLGWVPGVLYSDMIAEMPSSLMPPSG